MQTKETPDVTDSPSGGSSLQNQSDPKLRTKDDKAIGYVLGAPGGRSLAADFEDEAVRAYHLGRVFDTSKIPDEQRCTSSYIKQARGQYRPDERFAGTASWNALKGMFWASASLHAPPDGPDQKLGYNATFGAKAQRHLTCALYSLEELEQLRLLQTWQERKLDLADRWAQIFRGAQGVAQVARALHRLEIPTVLPVSFVDRRYSIDLFIGGRKEGQPDVCLQVKSQLGQYGNEGKAVEREIIIRIGDSAQLGWSRSVAEQALTANHIREFNRDFRMDCIPAFANIPLPLSPPHVPDQDQLVKQLRRFLATLA